MFENLTARLQSTFDKLRKRGKLTDRDVDVALREVRLALLEADVNYRVVKAFLGRVKERAIGAEVMRSLTPAHQVIKVVKGKGKKVGICGQAPSDFPEFAYFLVENGIDSISLNPDTILETTMRLAKMQEKSGKK